MKKIFSLSLIFILLLAMFTACSNNISSVSTISSTAVGTSSNSVDPSVSTDMPSTNTRDINAMLDSILNEIDFTATVTFGESDVAGSGIVSMDNVASIVGAQSNEYNSTGGMIFVMAVKPGTADSFKADLEKFCDNWIAYLGNYPDESKDAIKNTKEARIVADNDIVVYAVSPNGHEVGYEVLDTAISNALQSN